MIKRVKILMPFVCLLAGITVSAQEVGSVLTAAQMEQYQSYHKVESYIVIKGGTDAKGNTLYGLTDKNGKVIIPMVCPMYVFELSEGVFIAYEKSPDGTGGYVYIDTLGRHLNNEKYSTANRLKNGYAIVEKSEYDAGLINKSGKEVIPCNKKNYAVLEYSEGTVEVSPPEGDRYMYLVDTNGVVLIKNTEDIRLGNGGLHEGLINMQNYKAEKSGYADRTGKIVIPFKYESGSIFKEGLAAVMLNKKFGFIDKSGKLVIPATYYGAGNFSEGMAAVYIGNEDKSKMGFIDKTGKLVIPAIYGINGAEFKNGVAEVEDEKGNRITIDKTGKVVSN